MAITVTPKLEVSGVVGTITFATTSGSGCTITLVYTCDNFSGLYCNRFRLDEDNSTIPEGMTCIEPWIDLFPFNDYAASNDGFAVASAAFDDGETYLQFDDDSSIPAWLVFEIDLSAGELTKALPTSAKMILHTVSGELTARYLPSLETSLPTNAPSTAEDAGPEVASVDGEIAVDVTTILQTKLNSLSEGSTLAVAYVMIQVDPVGTSGDPKQIASSRHATASLRPYLRVKY